MISREDYIFTVGFSGNAAIVSKAMKSRYDRFSARALAEKGFFKPAVNMAFYDNNAEALEEVRKIYNEHNPVCLDSVEQLKHTFGVLEALDDNVDQVMYM